MRLMPARRVGPKAWAPLGTGLRQRVRPARCISSFPIAEGLHGVSGSFGDLEILEEMPVLSRAAAKTQHLHLDLRGLSRGENQKNDFNGFLRAHIFDSPLGQPESDCGSRQAIDAHMREGHPFVEEG